MQEALLSRRRVYFTEQQMYYECGDLCRQETMFISNVNSGTEMSDLVVGRSPIFEVVRDSFFVTRDIEAYSQRNLTYESDILNGFLGVFKVYSKLNPPLRHLWGIPILPRDMTGLAVCESFLAGLCWTSSSPSRRRLGFPSWCWTGWHSAVKFWPLLDPCTDSKVWVENAEGNQIEWDEAQELIAEGDSRMLGTNIHLEVWTFEVRFTHKIVTGQLSAHKGVVYQPLFHVDNYQMTCSIHLNLDLELEEGDNLFNRLITETWTCIILGRSGGEIQRALVVDTSGKITQRIGSLVIVLLRPQLPGHNVPSVAFRETRKKLILG
jgi:hypothetical protein